MFNFLTDEHRLIADAARSVFGDLAETDTAQRQTAKTRIDGAVVQRALIDLGLFGTSSEDAAMSCAQVQTVVAREAGAACLSFPVLENLAAHAVLMRAGHFTGAVHGPSLTTLSLLDTDDQATCHGTEGRVNGTVRLVPFAATAAFALIQVHAGGGAALAHIPLGTGGLQLSPRMSVEEDYPVFDLQLTDLRVAGYLDVFEDGRSAVTTLRQRTSLLAAAELAGVSRRMVMMTRDYLVSRTQFGAPLGSNQALKHALADALVKVEAMNAAVDYAAAAVDAGDEEAGPAVCAAKLYAGRGGKSIADAMLQLHGAIGYTMEYPLQLLMRRAYRLNAVHGSAGVQGERLYAAFLAA